MAGICNNTNKVKSHKKHHLTYIMLIDEKYYYVGSCSSNSPKEIDYHRIYINSGNQMMKAVSKGIISYREYRERCEIFKVESFGSREEALDREEELIEEFKYLFGDKCLNISTGNRHRGAKKEDQSTHPHLNGVIIESIHPLSDVEEMLIEIA